MGVQIARTHPPERLMLTFTCPRCKTLLSAPPEKAGALLSCPKCRGIVVAPVAPEGKQWTDLLSPPQAEGEMGRLGGYRVLSLLGNGGMGVVLRAEDPNLGREVALKVMLPHLVDPTHRRRFMREAKTAAVVEHENVVTIYQVGEDRGTPFIAMQLLRGESLEARILRDRKLDVVEAARIGREIALGLAAAHAKNIIHRDVKPGNVWLERGTNRVKLLDFGLARDTSSGQTSTIMGPMGTPSFMSPEQVRGETADARADLFALGCVMYRTLTGKLAFGGNDPVSTMMAVMSHDPAPPATVSPNVPREISGLVMRLLAKRPEDRPHSAAEVAQCLAGTDANLAWPTAVESARPPSYPALPPTPAPPAKKPLKRPGISKPPQGGVKRVVKLVVMTFYVLLALALAGAFVSALVIGLMDGWGDAGGKAQPVLKNAIEGPNEKDRQPDAKDKKQP